MKPIFFSAGLDDVIWSLLLALRDAARCMRGPLVRLRCVAGPEQPRRPCDGGRPMDIRAAPKRAGLC